MSLLAASSWSCARFGYEDRALANSPTVGAVRSVDEAPPDAAPTAACDGDTCPETCDPSGTFALQLSARGGWAAHAYVGAGSGTFRFWLKVELTRAGSSLDVSVTECGREFAGFDIPSTGERHRILDPTRLYDGGFLPAARASATSSGDAAGATLDWPVMATELGILLADPANDPWPTPASAIPTAMRADMDGDGKPGVTGGFDGGGGFVYPRTSANPGFNRADVSYFASRLAFSLQGTLSSCSVSSGTATVSHFDMAFYGCQRAGGTRDCDGTESGFFDTTAPVYVLGTTRYRLQRIANGGDCAAVRAALP